MDPLFFEVFEAVPRQGPGGRAHTERAWRRIRDLPSSPHVLDIGCGSGAQTLDLAGVCPGRIVALDFHAPFLRRLAGETHRRGISRRVAAVRGDMRALPFPDRTFDAIWSEGAAYSMGFGEALRSWRRVLRPGGAIAVTEVSWLREDPPPEVTAYWEREYPAITTIPANLAAIESAGYAPIDHFALPRETWDDFYGPMEPVLEEKRRAHASDPAALAVLAAFREEIETFRRYHDYFGYVFYIARAVA